MGNDLYGSHRTARRNGRPPPTRAADQLRDVGPRGGDRRRRRRAIGRLGRVRRAAGAGGRGRRILHRGRQRPERPVRSRDGPGQPSGPAAAVRVGHAPRGTGLHGRCVRRHGGPRGPRERVRLRRRDSQHCAHGPLRGGAQVPVCSREPRHLLPRRIPVPLRGSERVPFVDRAARPDEPPRGPRLLHDRGPGDYEGYPGRAGRRRPTDAPAADRDSARGMGRRPFLPRRRPPQPGAPPVARPVGGLRRPRHSRGRAVLHEPPQQPRSAPHHRGATPGRAGRPGLGPRDDPDGLFGRRTGDAGRRGGRCRVDLPQESNGRRAVRPRRAAPRDETRVPRGGERGPRTGAGSVDPRGPGGDRDSPRRRRGHPHPRGGEGRDPRRGRHRRDRPDRGGSPRRGCAPSAHRDRDGGMMHVVRAKTAGESAAETTRIARRLFISPPPQRIVLPIVAFSLMEAYLLVYPSLDWSRVLLGGVAIALPAYLSAFGTVPLANRLGGRMYFRRSFLLSFVGLILLGAFQLVAVVVLTINAIAFNSSFLGRIDRVTILGYGAVLWVREVILSVTSNSKHLRSLPAASLHPVLGLAGLALFVSLRPDEVVLALAVYALFFLSAIAYAEIAKRPLLRSFGVDGLKLLRSTLDHYTEPEASGIAELEAFFDSISVAARVRVGGLAFRVGARLKALFVAPTVHPGPMGYVSGSDLPSKIARDLTDLTPNVLVAHGPTTHDENPATTSEVHKVGETIRKALGALAYTRPVGRACRAMFKRATALAQAFGDVVLIVASFARQPAAY